MWRESQVLYALIVGCEITFWAVLVLALGNRYLLGRERLSRALLICLPLVDLLLITVTAVDLHLGATPAFAHGLAAAYIGFTIAFGGMAVKWADERFAHSFAAGPAPSQAPSRGWALVRYDLILWFRCIGAAVITMALVEALAYLSSTAAAAEPLLAWHKHAFGAVIVWFVFGPAWSMATAWRPAR
jgi:hypothetical protein